jgi:multicomponent Na+:H+ antiporter subunit D
MSEMAAWLVVWPIAIPLIGASIAIVLWGRPNAQSAIGLIAITLQLVASLALLGHVWTNGPVAMSMGGWPAPFGIAMAADTLGAGLTAAASAVALALLVYGCSWRW